MPKQGKNNQNRKLAVGVAMLVVAITAILIIKDTGLSGASFDLGAVLVNTTNTNTNSQILPWNMNTSNNVANNIGILPWQVNRNVSIGNISNSIDTRAITCFFAPQLCDIRIGSIGSSWAEEDRAEADRRAQEAARRIERSSRREACLACYVEQHLCRGGIFDLTGIVCLNCIRGQLPRGTQVDMRDVDACRAMTR